MSNSKTIFELTTISTASAREQQDLVACGAARVEVQASISKGANNKSKTRLVVVHSRGDDVPLEDSQMASGPQYNSTDLFGGTSVTRLSLDGDEVLTEVSAVGVDEEALSVRRLWYDMSAK